MGGGTPLPPTPLLLQQRAHLERHFVHSPAVHRGCIVLTPRQGGQGMEAVMVPSEDWLWAQCQGRGSASASASSGGGGSGGGGLPGPLSAAGSGEMPALEQLLAHGAPQHGLGRPTRGFLLPFLGRVWAKEGLLREQVCKALLRELRSHAYNNSWWGEEAGFSDSLVPSALTLEWAVWSPSHWECFEDTWLCQESVPEAGGEGEGQGLGLAAGGAPRRLCATRNRAAYEVCRACGLLNPHCQPKLELCRAHNARESGECEACAGARAKDWLGSSEEDYPWLGCCLQGAKPLAWRSDSESRRAFLWRTSRLSRCAEEAAAEAEKAGVAVEVERRASGRELLVSIKCSSSEGGEGEGEGEGILISSSSAGGGGSRLPHPLSMSPDAMEDALLRYAEQFEARAAADAQGALDLTISTAAGSSGNLASLASSSSTGWGGFPSPSAAASASATSSASSPDLHGSQAVLEFEQLNKAFGDQLKALSRVLLLHAQWLQESGEGAEGLEEGEAVAAPQPAAAAAALLQAHTQLTALFLAPSPVQLSQQRKVEALRLHSRLVACASARCALGGMLLSPPCRPEQEDLFAEEGCQRYLAALQLWKRVHSELPPASGSGQATLPARQAAFDAVRRAVRAHVGRKGLQLQRYAQSLAGAMGGIEGGSGEGLGEPLGAHLQEYGSKAGGRAGGGGGGGGGGGKQKRQLAPEEEEDGGVTKLLAPVKATMGELSLDDLVSRQLKAAVKGGESEALALSVAQRYVGLMTLGDDLLPAKARFPAGCVISKNLGKLRAKLGAAGEGGEGGGHSTSASLKKGKH